MRARVLLCLALAVCVVAQQPVSVTIDSGVVVGVWNAATNAKYFKGVPFAADAGGSNRFQPPQAVAPWSTPLNASDFGPGCVQLHHNPDVPSVQSEACLNLNVYTPAWAAAGANLPVILFFHGGAFLEGSNQGPFGMYNGEFMAVSGNVTVVTANYRLGALGFVVTSNLNGNLGLLDQRAAMQWVQRNIAAFGGNPGSVTIAGESAGAMSAGLHLLSPGSAGLFHRAIMESNPLGLLYKDINQARDYGNLFCQYLNCTSDSVCSTECMAAQSLDAIKNAWSQSEDNIIAYIEANLLHLLDGLLSFTPVVDGEIVAQEPVDALQAGKLPTGIDILLGSNTNEAETFVYDALDTPIPVLLGELGIDLVWVSAGGSINARYKNASDTDGRQVFSRVLTDYLFRCPAQQFLLAAKTNGANAWVYRYDHVFSQGWLFPKFGLPAVCSNETCHAAELPFVFHFQLNSPALNVSFTPAEATLSQSFVDYWTSFAWYGNPNTEAGSPRINWPAFDSVERNGIVLNDESSVESSADLCQFWDAIGYDHVDAYKLRTALHKLAGVSEQTAARLLKSRA